MESSNNQASEPLVIKTYRFLNLHNIQKKSLSIMNPITHWWFPENRATPYHPFINGFSIVNLPFLDPPFMETPTCSPCLGYVGSPHAARPPARPHDLV